MGKRINSASLIAFVVLLAAATVGVSGAAARGSLFGLGGQCGGNTSQPFAQWGDFSSYYLAPNGGLESGSYGWSLGGGASVGSGNEPFLYTGSHSLNLPSGAGAPAAASTSTGPTACQAFASLSGTRSTAQRAARGRSTTSTSIPSPPAVADRLS